MSGRHGKKGEAGTQLELLTERLPSIAGLRYRSELVPVELENSLIAGFKNLDFTEFEFRGYRGKRRIVSFGTRYDFNENKTHTAPDIPDFLLPLRELAAGFAGLEAPALKHALVTEYQPGAAIGWHCDRPVFEEVVGVSLLSPCRFRLRRRTGSGWHREALTLEPRSAYLLRGNVREQWEHSIPPAEQLRYSVTFRSLRSSAV